jgi:hypothetical protein
LGPKAFRLSILAPAILTFVLTSNAKAATQWYFEGHDIPVGETVEVPAHGTLKLYFREKQQTKIEMTCAASGTQAFWNTSETGRDETKTFVLSCTAGCGKIVIQTAPPWSSILLAPDPYALPDEWKGVRLNFSCGGTDYGVFEGTLNPVSGDGDPQGQDEPDSFLDFRVGQTLYSPSKPTSLTFTGYYKLRYQVGEKQVDVVTGRR